MLNTDLCLHATWKSGSGRRHQTCQTCPPVDPADKISLQAAAQNNPPSEDLCPHANVNPAPILNFHFWVNYLFKHRVGSIELSAFQHRQIKNINEFTTTATSSKKCWDSECCVLVWMSNPFFYCIFGKKESKEIKFTVCSNVSHKLLQQMVNEC